MGNVNNCLSNPFENEEIRIRPEKNLATDKTFKNLKSRERYYSNNKKNLDIINEEENQETKSQLEKIQKEQFNTPMNYKIKQKSSKLSNPKDIKILENKFNQNFNNNINLNNNNNDFKILDNNVLFNSTRKNDTSHKNKNNYNYKINNDNNSENNLEPKKLINSEDESENLIVLDYNRPETTNINKNMNTNINNTTSGYSNNDFTNNKENKIYNIDNNNNIEKNHGINNLNLVNNKINSNNINDNNKNNKNNPNNYYNDNNNLIGKEEGPKDNLINRNSINNMKNNNRESQNNFKNNIPYVKPRFSSNYNNNSIIDIKKKKIILNQKKEKKNEPINNNLNNYTSKYKTQTTPNFIKMNPMTSLNNQEKDIKNNNNNNLNKRYENNLISETNNNGNSLFNQNDNIKYISGSRKLNSEPFNSQMPTQRQYIQNPQDINNIIQYNNTNFKTNSRIKIDNNQMNENENTIIRNNKTNPDIKIEINNEIPKNEENMSPDEKILYQSATLDNVQEDDNNILYQSASLDNNELNKIQQKEINSIINQNNQQIPNEEYEIGKYYEYSKANEQVIIQKPIIAKEYNYDEIISQQKEQKKK